MALFRTGTTPGSRWLVALAFVGAAVAGSCSNRSSSRPIVLVTVDALRADRLGVYGAAPSRTPNFDRIGREGAVIATAFAPAARTSQSIGSVFTGLHPLRHGADGLGMHLPDRVQTLAEQLSGAGYATAAFASNIFLRPGLGFEQGFDTYSNPPPRWEGDSAPSITRETLRWIDDRLREQRPFFVWLHYLEPHWTYEPPTQFLPASGPRGLADDAVLNDLLSGRAPIGPLVFGADRLLSPAAVDYVRRLYDAEVAAVDGAFGELLRGLEQRRILDDAIVVLTADHGESLGEQKYWFAHGEYLYDSTLRVPFAVRAPRLTPAGTTIEGVARLEDLAPTVLDLAGARALVDIDGRSLAPMLRAGGRQVAPRVRAIHFSDHLLVRPENLRRPVEGRAGRWWAIRDGEMKLIQIPLAGGLFEEELYDLAADPLETRNIAAENPEVAARLRETLATEQRRLLAAWQTSGAEEAASPQSEALRGLGYIQ